MIKMRVLLVMFVIQLTWALKSVTISKCCAINQYLDSENKCRRNESSSWDLRVYNGRKRTFENYSTLPKHWIVKDSVMPNCARKRRLLLQGKNNFPFFNGSLYSIEFDQLFHPDQYCLDYQSSIVCLKDLPENITHVVVKKCCGRNAIFSQANSSCRAFKDNTYNIDVGRDKTLGAGFPECVDNRMQVVGELQKSKLLSNGSLELESKLILPARNFCLEYILEHNSKTSFSIFYLAKNILISRLC